MRLYILGRAILLLTMLLLEYPKRYDSIKPPQIGWSPTVLVAQAGRIVKRAVALLDVRASSIV